MNTDAVRCAPATPALVYMVDDHAFFRAGVGAWMRNQTGLICCGEANTLQQARADLKRVAPDILLLDLGFIEGDALEFIRESRQLYPTTRIIVLSQREETIFAERTVRAGASGYVMKSEAVDRLYDAIQVVLDGGVYLSPVVSALASGNLRSSQSRSGVLGRLSDRELQVFTMIGMGLGPSQIATRIGISAKTVETYREHLKVKLGVASASQLAEIATAWIINNG